jgi:lipid II:glycine glycyltransferase (peptidoglycan interpeptide bridge formation enzyme)
MNHPQRPQQHPFQEIIQLCERREQLCDQEIFRANQAIYRTEQEIVILRRQYEQKTTQLRQRHAQVPAQLRQVQQQTRVPHKSNKQRQNPKEISVGINIGPLFIGLRIKG